MSNCNSGLVVKDAYVNSLVVPKTIISGFVCAPDFNSSSSSGSGTVGPTGPTGPSGISGQIGPVGPTGAPGNVETNTGPTGATGPQQVVNDVFLLHGSLSYDGPPTAKLFVFPVGLNTRYVRGDAPPFASDVFVTQYADTNLRIEEFSATVGREFPFLTTPASTLSIVYDNTAPTSPFESTTVLAPTVLSFPSLGIASAVYSTQFGPSSSVTIPSGTYFAIQVELSVPQQFFFVTWCLRLRRV